MSTSPKFETGQYVRKIKGAKFWGIIVGDSYKTFQAGEWHYNVMAIHPDFLGTVHIMVESQLERIEIPTDANTTSIYDWYPEDAL